MNQKTTKILSFILMVIAVIALLLKINMLLTGHFQVFSAIGMCFYIVTSVFGLKLSKYTLQKSEVKTVIVRLILGIISCLLSLFFEGIIVLIISVIVFGFFYTLKSNYDEWNQKMEDRKNNK